ncbi:MAG: hypothetical protein Q3988_02595 [Gemella sp.]|nr:hypothetical protein [Gemella sp.]
MLKRLYKYVDVTSGVYFLLVVAEIIIELFKLGENSTITTVFGVRMTNHTTPETLSTDFILDKSFFIQYFIFISVVIFMTYILPLKKNRNN